MNYIAIKLYFLETTGVFPLIPPKNKIVSQQYTLLEMSELGKVSPQISIILKTAFSSMEYFGLK